MGTLRLTSLQLWRRVSSSLRNIWTDSKLGLINRLKDGWMRRCAISNSETGWGERPAGLSIKPPKPPFYEGTRHGTFSQWVFHVRQYLQMMCITDEAYGVQFATTYLRGSAALWWQNIVETRGFDAITTWEGFHGGSEFTIWRKK